MQFLALTKPRDAFPVFLRWIGNHRVLSAAAPDIATGIDRCLFVSLLLCSSFLGVTAACTFGLSKLRRGTLSLFRSG
jgi:hypothetical protein